MSGIKSHRDLRAWQLAYSFGLRIYKVSATFPSDERFGLISQIRRSAISVASNIAEGYGRGSTTDYIRFLRVARGSLFEVDTQLLYSKDLGYLTAETHRELFNDWNGVSMVLAGLIKSLEPNA